LDKFSKNALLNMQQSLLKKLYRISSETFYIEFCANNIHFIKKFLGDYCSEESDTHSDTEYRKFVKKMYRGGLKEFFEEYSVLARLISQTVCFWVDFMEEVTNALEKDQVEISRIFFNENILGKVISIDIGLSDSHNNHRTVVKITFENNKSIIYKPRNVGIEASYYKLLDFLNQKDNILSLSVLKILDCKNYGWVEFVEYLPCHTAEQVKNYFIRAGELLCITYLFGGTDIHLENIIASGESPVLVDLEMLISNKREPFEMNSNLDIDDLISEPNSVFYSGILPILHINKDGVLSDLSGLGGETDVETTLKVPRWENINKDSMHLEFNYVSKLSYKNVVKLN
jgi:type 2 lantibiotic biosynthesis protein LanM